MREQLFAFVFSFVVSGAALVGGRWASCLIDRTNKPETPMVIVTTVVWGLLAFIALAAAMYALGVFGVEDEEPGNE